MAARPYYTAPYLPHLLERTATTMDTAQGHLEEHHLTRGNTCYYDDRNLTPLHYGYTCKHGDLRYVVPALPSQDRIMYPPLQHQYDDLDYRDQSLTPLHYGKTDHNDDLRCAVPALPSHDRIVYPPLQHHYDDLNLLELGRHGRFQEPGPPLHDAADEELEFGGRGRCRYRDSLPRDAANEKLMYGRRGHCPNRVPLPYDVADAGLEYGLYGRRPNRISTPYDTTDDRFISDDNRRGRVRSHSFGIDWPPFASSDTGIDSLDGGSFHQIYLGPRNRHSRSRLRGHHDLGSDHLGRVEPHLRRRLVPRLDDYISDHDIAMREPHYDFGRAGVPPAARYSTEHAFEANSENYASETNFREAHARRPFKHYPTGQHSNFDFPSLHQDTWNLTAVQLMSPSHHVRKRNGPDAEGRLQELRKEFNGAVYPERELAIEHPRPARRDRRRQRSHAAQSRPAARLPDSDLEGSPRGRPNLPFRAHRSRNRTHSPRIKRASLPVHVAADPTAKDTAPRVQKHHTQRPVGHANHKATPHHSGPGPVVNISSKHDIPPDVERAAREITGDIAHGSRIGLGGKDCVESSSDSGCCTPDEDSDVGRIGGVGYGDVRGGDVLQSFVHIEL